uniref:RING-type domain-containing protein n=1 Tax=Mesocestoides corti TaxID=53468 RepID=A0A5K3FVM7_MESCO
DRVIRHVRDYGAVFLCDERFASPDARSHLPVWMRSGVRVYNTFGPAMKETSDFFRSAQSKYPALLSKLTGSQTATMTGQSCAPNSLKRQFLASLKSPGDGFQFPCASNHISTWAESLAPGGVTGDFLQSYTPQQPEACSVTAEAKEESTNSSNSVLDRVYCNIEKSSMTPAEPFKRPASDDLVAGKPRDDDDGDAALEARLLNHHQAAKRIKLVKQHINPETGGSLSPADYLQSVKRLFQNASPDKENRSFKDFKSALLTYKASEKEKGLSAVQRVFTSLANLFIPNDAPGLLRDFIVFVRESEKPRYAELCKGLTGLATASGSKDGGPSPAVSASSEVAKPSSSSKAVALSCARCKKTPIPDPLRAPCSHICCFPCWRSIIEQGNRRCPSCSILVRRRNLVRLARPTPVQNDPTKT